MKESLKVLLSSRYVRDLATLVVAYGISINLVEVTWKSKLKAQVNFLLLLFGPMLYEVCSPIWICFSNLNLIHLTVSQPQ